MTVNTIYEDTSASSRSIDINQDLTVFKTTTTPLPLANIGNTCYLNVVLQILINLNHVFNFGHWITDNLSLDSRTLSNKELLQYLSF